MTYTMNHKMKWRVARKGSPEKKFAAICACLCGRGDCDRCFFLLPEHCPVTQARRLLREMDLAAQGLITAQNPAPAVRRQTTRIVDAGGTL